MPLAGLTPDVIDIYPEATVVGSKVALMYLQGLTHRPFEQKVVKGGDKIDLGGGHEVEFIMAPNLHWPDTIFSFDHGTGGPCFKAWSLELRAWDGRSRGFGSALTAGQKNWTVQRPGSLLCWIA